jgi:hypothetical protein
VGGMGASATSEGVYFGQTGIACDSDDGRVGVGNCGRWAVAAGDGEIIAKRRRGFAVQPAPSERSTGVGKGQSRASGHENGLHANADAGAHGSGGRPSHIASYCNICKPASVLDVRLA